MRSRSSARARSAYSAPSLLIGGPRLIPLPVIRAPAPRCLPAKRQNRPVGSGRRPVGSGSMPVGSESRGDPDLSLIQPCLTCNPLERSRKGRDVGRILLAILAIIAVFILIGPLVGFVFTLIKWGLIIGAVAFGIMLVSKWART